MFLLKLSQIVATFLILTLCLTLPASAEEVTFEHEPMETVYFLPKDNVDYALDPELDYLVVGEHQPISTDFICKMEEKMVIIPNDVDGDMIGVERATYTAYMLLRRDLLINHNIEIGIWDGYRTLKDHEWLYGDKFSPDEQCYSEHHTGLLLNIVIKFGEYWYNEAAVRQDETISGEIRSSDAFEILRTVMPDYGFITRFPQGKENLTGSNYNPNKIRFVGNKEIAHAITDNNLCLEEYVAENH